MGLESSKGGDKTRAFRKRNEGRPRKKRLGPDAVAIATSHTITTGDGRTLVCSKGARITRLPSSLKPPPIENDHMSFNAMVFGHDWK